MILFFFLAFMVRCLGLVPAVIDDDEAWFAASGAVLKKPGDFFHHALDNKPPGTAWYYWVVQHLSGTGTDPRLARLVFILLLAGTAWVLGRCVARLRDAEAGKVTALSFFIMSALPSPKMMATTTEGLMLPLISVSIWVWLDALLRTSRGTSRVCQARIALAGLMIGAALILKQTAAFFLTPAVYAIWILYRRRAMGWVGVLVFCLALTIPLGLTLFALGPTDLWYWSYVYPKTVLTQVRGNLFWEWRNLFGDLLILAVVLWPLSLTLRFWLNRYQDAGERTPAESLIAVWAFAGFAAVLAGKGLFLHYYLLMLPPLTVLMGLSWHQITSRVRMAAWIWLGASYFLVCAITAVPGAGALWGTDSNYYEKLGTEIQTQTRKDERIFVWGGNALPLVYANRLPGTRFITSRFASAPYATDETLEIFHHEFVNEQPALFVDLHERGDNEFNYPVSIYPWLRDELRLHYLSYRNPALPWAVFYQRVGDTGSTLGARAILAAQNSGVLALDFDSINAALAHDLEHPVPEILTTGIRNWRVLWDLDPVLRSWFSLESLLNADPAAAASETVRALYGELQQRITQDRHLIAGSLGRGETETSDRNLVENLMKRTEQEFLKRGFPKPLALESRGWWISLAVVKLQPVALPRSGS